MRAFTGRLLSAAIALGLLFGATAARAQGQMTEEQKKKVQQQLKEALDKAKAGQKPTTAASPAPAPWGKASPSPAAVPAPGAAGAGRADKFAAWDTDKDGFLSRGEYTATGGHPGNFQNLDKNGDGKLSRSEFMNR